MEINKQILKKSFEKLRERIENETTLCDYWVKVYNESPDSNKKEVHHLVKTYIKNGFEKLGVLRLLLLDIIEIIYQFAPVGSVLYIATTELNDETYKKINELKNVLNGIASNENPKNEN
jgi:hypothetical protein